MRDASELQPLTLPLPSLGSRDDIIHHAAMQEVDRAHRQTQAGDSLPSRSPSPSRSPGASRGRRPASPSRLPHPSPSAARPPAPTPQLSMSESSDSTSARPMRPSVGQHTGPPHPPDSLLRSAIMASYRQPSTQAGPPMPHDMIASSIGPSPPATRITHSRQYPQLMAHAPPYGLVPDERRHTDSSS